MSDLRIAQKFLDDFGNNYLRLLETAKGSCQTLQQKLGPNIIDDVYTRKASTHGPSEFKEAGKIARKVRESGQSVGPASFLRLNDIVGLTIVLQYPDDVASVITQLRSLLKDEDVTTEEPKEHKNTNGYYATHIVCGGGFPEVKCEIQVKTILHDAWSAKMHDLTYKPQGVLDKRHEQLMASIAESIESLEKQSTLIRRMIKAGWNVEERARRNARRSLFDKVSYRQILDQAPQNRTEILDLHDRIEAATGILEKEQAGHPEIQGLLRAVDSVCRTPENLRQGWMMAGRIASLRSAPDLVLAFIPYADAWLERVSTCLVNGGINEKEISAVPSMFYVIGDLDRAIDYAYDMLNGSLTANLSEERKKRINYNRAAFLVEREYHSPTTHAPTRESLKQEIESILDATTALDLDDMRSSILDTRGLTKIAFAPTKDDVRLGIAKCTEALSAATPEDRAISEAYVELNLRLGWRRYFELEAAEPVP